MSKKNRKGDFTVLYEMAAPGVCCPKCGEIPLRDVGWLKPGSASVKVPTPFHLGRCGYRLVLPEAAT